MRIGYAGEAAARRRFPATTGAIPLMAARKPKIKNTIDRKHRKLTRKDVHAAAKRLKNWGRWGKNDEIGTLNFVTPADVVAAAGLVRKGKVISLALNYD